MDKPAKKAIGYTKYDLEMFLSKNKIKIKVTKTKFGMPAVFPKGPKKVFCKTDKKGNKRSKMIFLIILEIGNNK